MQQYFIGVDVGSASARAALFDSSGNLVSSHTSKISIFSPAPDFYEQSSRQIWSAICLCTRHIIQQSQIDVRHVKSIGFDATCSMVIVGETGPVHVSKFDVSDSNGVYNGEVADVIMWMDHRATKEAEEINGTHHSVLDFVGGRVSVEMQVPKLLWFKRNCPELWGRVKYFFDLPDYLTFKATGSSSAPRSTCSATCKWTYSPRHSGFAPDFFQQIGLEDLVQDQFVKMGGTREGGFRVPGYPVGTLCQQAAQELGLSEDTVVASSLIDAYAGALGTLPIQLPSSSDSLDTLTHRLALIAGTSACHIALLPSKSPPFVPGCWGPYAQVLLPSLWALEGGQSAAGKLIDYILDSHPAHSQLKSLSETAQVDKYTYLAQVLDTLRGKRGLDRVDYLTSSVHILPDFHGSRSFALGSSTGIMHGLTLAMDVEDLAVKYLACLFALAYGTRYILTQMEQCLMKQHHDRTETPVDRHANGGGDGKWFREVVVSGGLCANELYLYAHANACSVDVLVPGEHESSVLLGSAILAQCAYSLQAKPSAVESSNEKVERVLVEVMDRMTRSKSVKRVRPDTVQDARLRMFHENKFKVFEMLLMDQLKYQQVMSSW